MSLFIQRPFIPALMLFLQAVSSTFSLGPCPSVFSSSEEIISLKSSNFLYSNSQLSPADYLGTWFDIYRNLDFRFARGNCTQAYYFIEDGHIVALNSEIVDGQNISAKAEVFIDPNIQGQLYAKFHHLAPAGDYKIVHTDYTSTALVFSCKSFVVVHWKWAWIMGRHTKIKPPSFYFELIEKFGIPLEGMHRTSHDNC
jgi:lipocalin